MFSPLVSHLELFPQFRFVFLCGQISSNQAQWDKNFFFYKNYSRLFFILRMILKNEIENQKGKKEGKKGGNERLWYNHSSLRIVPFLFYSV